MAIDTNESMKSANYRTEPIRCANCAFYSSSVIKYDCGGRDWYEVKRDINKFCSKHNNEVHKNGVCDLYDKKA